MNRKVLIITYYWPPSGGSGVQRWLKFVKYLPLYGWEPHVFTPENPSFAVRDPSLERDVPNEAEVLRFPIWEPYDLFLKISRLFGGRKNATPTSLVSSRRKSLFETLSTWVRGNLFIPDPRIFWIKPSVRFLSDYIKDNGIQIVITTGPPHSIHLIGLRLKKRYPPLRWLADFRDPWTDWGIWDSLMVSGPVRRRHKSLESQVLKTADEIATITPFYVRRFEALSGRKVHLLTNGFDEEDFAQVRRTKPGRFLIRHVGIVNERCNPRPFLLALKAEMLADQQFAADTDLEFIGEVHPDVMSFVHGSADLSRVTKFVGNIPHADLLKIYGSSALLLFILTGYKDAEGFLPGKLFEYLAIGLPILGVGPVDGDAGRLLKQTGAGLMIDSDDEAAMRASLRMYYDRWKAGESMESSYEGRTRFSRKEITGRLSDILSDLSIQRP